MGQQKFATAGRFLRDLFEKSGEGQIYQIPVEGETPWLIGVFNRTSDGSRSNFSGLELVVMREVRNVFGYGKDKFVQLARFEDLSLAKSVYPIGYAHGDLVPDEGKGLKPSWDEMTKLRGNAMSDVIKLAPCEKRDWFSPITRGQSASRVLELVEKLVELPGTLAPVDTIPDLDIFK